MDAAPATKFRQSDVTRALKGAKMSGLGVARLRIKDGTIQIDIGKPQEGDGKEGEPSDNNPWDTI